MPTYLTLQLLLTSQTTITEKSHVLHRHAVHSSIPDTELQSHWDAKGTCRFHTCFEINNCSVANGDKIGVFVYPEADFVFEETRREVSLFSSVECQELVEAVKGSPYHQGNASRACVFIPAVDTMSQDMVDEGDLSLILHSLPQ